MRNNVTKYPKDAPTERTIQSLERCSRIGWVENLICKSCVGWQRNKSPRCFELYYAIDNVEGCSVEKEAALGKDEKRSQAKIMTSLNFSPCCCVMIKGLQKQRPPFYLSILQKGHHLHENGASPASSSLFRYIITGWVKITWNESNLCKIALNFLSNFPIAIYVRHNHHSRLHLHTQIELWHKKCATRSNDNNHQQTAVELIKGVR